MRSGNRTTGLRLTCLDELRGIAASLVVLAHVGPLVSDQISWLYTHVVDLGQLGVVMFFLCSGFVIPASLERERSVGAFWIKRFFRLYPLFWVSLIGAALLAVTHLRENGELSLRDWALNVTMIPDALGGLVALPPYWTLAYEMVFYVFATLIFLTRLTHMSVQTSLITSFIGICFGAVFVLPPTPPLNATIFWIGTLLTGTVVYRAYVGEVRTRSMVICVVGTLAAGIVTATHSLYGLPSDGNIFRSHFWPTVIAYVGAYAFFFAFLLLRQRSASWMIFLGTVSYSMYLMHDLVLSLVPDWGPSFLPILFGYGFTVAVSAVTFKYVEAPCIELGRSWAGRYKAWRGQAPTGAPPVDVPAGPA